MNFQYSVKNLVDKSYKLRGLSKKILKDITEVVELAIEEGEEHALHQLNILKEKYEY